MFFTLILVYSQRLNIGGVGPATVLGVRMPLYVLVAATVYYLAPDFPQPTRLGDSETLLYVQYLRQLAGRHETEVSSG